MFSMFSHHITLLLCWNVYLSTDSTLFHMTNPCRQEENCFVAIPFSTDLEGTEAGLTSPLHLPPSPCCRALADSDLSGTACAFS